VSYQKDISSRELVDVFGEKVELRETDDLTLYRYKPAEDSNGQVTIAIEFQGPGLWGPIKGFLALRKDMRTVSGITFYEQEETPGLGGEIASQWFRSRFKGKKMVSSSGKPGIIIKGNGNNAVNEVDAITGATMTCDKLQSILNSVISKVVKEYDRDGQQ